MGNSKHIITVVIRVKYEETWYLPEFLMFLFFIQKVTLKLLALILKCPCIYA